jgi:alkyl sulfatase BDS1-like metallo-beta-lactamase superfamily hydrolase
MRISNRCYAITGLGFTPPWEVNAGFIVGDAKTLVVDTWPTYFAARTVYGYARSARPNNEMIAVNTEMHVDHIMGNSFFQEMAESRPATLLQSRCFFKESPCFWESAARRAPPS